jgi:hypothetical protein
VRGGDDSVTGFTGWGVGFFDFVTVGSSGVPHSPSGDGNLMWAREVLDDVLFWLLKCFIHDENCVCVCHFCICWDIQL